MLVSFSCSNYMSIDSEQRLLLTTSYRPNEIPGNVIDQKVPGMSGISYLKGAALYGANASGKSNFLTAVDFMRKYVYKSATQMDPTGGTGVLPFLLNTEANEKPSTFEVTFVHEGVRYDYGFSLNQKQILSEWLYSYPYGKSRTIFERTKEERSDKYTYKYGNKRAAFSDLEKKTRDNALFLSVGVQFNVEEFKAPYEWLVNHLIILDLSGEGMPSRFSARKFYEKPDIQNMFIKLIREADLGIEGVEVDLSKFDDKKLIKPDDVPDIVHKYVVSKMKEEDIYEVRFLHSSQDVDRPVKFDFGLESGGTQRFFSLIAPWLDVLENGWTMFVDELESSLHPLLVQKLISMINSEANQNGAQLIFTTHNTSLLDFKLLRRDQIWFTEKDQGGATRLYPLTDYRPRNDESLEKGYLAGRYGAIPMLGGFFVNE